MRGSGELSDPPSVAFFKSVPWCASHLASHPNVKYWNPLWAPDDQRQGDELFTTTLNTESTIPHVLFFYIAPPGPDEIVHELCALMALEQGVGGFPRFAHGGAIMTILDEVTGLVSSLNRKRGAFKHGPSMTGTMNTQFLKPVKAPSIVLVRARIVKMEERKVFIEGSVEDSEGMVLARADVLFITLKRKPKL